MRLYFIRHGEGVGNQQKFLQGTIDIPLSEKGFEQAESLGNRLSEISFDVLYCSPLSRAQQTADAILAHHPHLEKVIDERLTGRNYGVFQGKPYSDITGPDRQNLERLYKKAEGLEGVEPWAMVADRAIACVEDIIEKYPGKKVLIITHNEVKASSIQQLIQMNMPNDYYSSSVSILEYEDGVWDYLLLNDISHLSPDERVE